MSLSNCGSFPKEIFSSFIFRSFECLRMWPPCRPKYGENAEKWEPAAQAYSHHPHSIAHLDWSEGTKREMFLVLPEVGF